MKLELCTPDLKRITVHYDNKCNQSLKCNLRDQQGSPTQIRGRANPIKNALSYKKQFIFPNCIIKDFINNLASLRQKLFYRIAFRDLKLKSMWASHFEHKAGFKFKKKGTT